MPSRPYCPAPPPDPTKPCCLAHDGHAALALAREDGFELLIFDIGMPGLSRCELAQEVRRLPHSTARYLPPIPAGGAEHDRSGAREAGFDAHLTKPAGLEEIDALPGRPVSTV